MKKASYKIGTFGHRGVGKSTYLTTLYILLSQSRYEDIKIEFGEDARLLSDYLEKVVDEYDSSGKFQLPATDGFPSETNFTLFRKKKEYVINLFDYRGEDSERNKMDEKVQENIDSVLDHFKKCDAIMYFFTDDIVLGENQKNTGYRIKRINDLKTFLVRLKASTSGGKIIKPFIFVLTKGDSQQISSDVFNKNQDILRILNDYVDNCKTTLISSKLAFENLYNDPSFVVKEQQPTEPFYLANTDVAYPLFYLIDELDKAQIPPPQRPRPTPPKEEGLLDLLRKIFGVIVLGFIIFFLVKTFSGNSGVAYKAYFVGHNVRFLKDSKHVTINDTIITIDGIQEVAIIDSELENGVKWYNIDYTENRGWVSSVYIVSKEQMDNASSFYANCSRVPFYKLDGRTFKKKSLT